MKPLPPTVNVYAPFGRWRVDAHVSAIIKIQADQVVEFEARQFLIEPPASRSEWALAIGLRSAVISADKAALEAETNAQPVIPAETVKALKAFARYAERRSIAHHAATAAAIAHRRLNASLAEHLDKTAEVMALTAWMHHSLASKVAGMPGRPEDTYLRVFVQKLAADWCDRTGFAPAATEKPSRRPATPAQLFHCFVRSALTDVGRAHQGRIGHFLGTKIPQKGMQK